MLLPQWGRQVCVSFPRPPLTPTTCCSLETEAILFPKMRLALRSWTHLGRLSVLVQDEGHLGAVHLGRHLLACAHVEHGQSGAWPEHVSAHCHLSQFLCVPTDGAIVEHLDAEGTGPAEASALGISPHCFGVQPGTTSEPPSVFPTCDVGGDTHLMGEGRTNRKFYGASSVPSD